MCVCVRVNEIPKIIYPAKTSQQTKNNISTYLYYFDVVKSVAENGDFIILIHLQLKNIPRKTNHRLKLHCLWLFV